MADFVRYANTFETYYNQCEKYLDYAKFAPYLQYVPTFFNALIYPTATLATMAHRFTYPYVMERVQPLYENQFGKPHLYTIDYKGIFAIAIGVGKKVPHVSDQIALFEKVLSSGIIEEIASSEGKTVGAWVKELEESKQTVDAWVDSHPATKKLLPLFQFDITPLRDVPIHLLFAQLKQTEANEILTKFEQSNIIIKDQVKPITEWKITFDQVIDQNDIKWVCCQIAISAFLTIPLTYISREIMSALLGRRVEISPFSAVRYEVITGVISAILSHVAVSKIVELDSSRKKL